MRALLRYLWRKLRPVRLDPVEARRLTSAHIAEHQRAFEANRYAVMAHLAEHDDLDPLDEEHEIHAREHARLLRDV